MNRTLDETKRGLQCLVNLGNDDCEFPLCNKCSLYVAGYTSTEIISDMFLYIQQLETELEPLRKAKEEGRLIILPYAPGTPVYVADDYDVVQMEYHPSMYGRRCNISEEEFYKEWHKELGINGN